jgi:hypothetical protein
LGLYMEISTDVVALNVSSQVMAMFMLMFEFQGDLK